MRNLIVETRLNTMVGVMSVAGITTTTTTTTKL